MPNRAAAAPAATAATNRRSDPASAGSLAGPSAHRAGACRRGDRIHEGRRMRRPSS
ncbi:hypothetical protein [Lysobacter gummosus]|uniref:hypothetical protein n=1 Tax=Lysobacter gummosus TaxID=262324 RepID=UPI00363EB7F3